MLRFVSIFFCLTSVAMAQGSQTPNLRPKITTAEEALLCFRAERDGTLKTELSETDFQKHDYAGIVALSQTRSLSIRRLQPRNYQAPFSTASVLEPQHAGHIYGRFDAASSCKNDTWELTYPQPVTRSSVLVYLDGV